MLNGVQWSETKGNHYLNLLLQTGTCYVVQVIKAHAPSEILFQIPNFSPVSFLFCSSFYYLFVNKKNLYVDLSCRTMLVRSVGWTLASTLFRHLETRLGRLFFAIGWNYLLQIVALVRHQALFKTIINFMITSLKGVKTHVHATWTNPYIYTNFTVSGTMVFVAVVKALGHWDVGWFNAGLDIFPSLDNTSWRAFLFSFSTADYFYFEIEEACKCSARAKK